MSRSRYVVDDYDDSGRMNLYNAADGMGDDEEKK